VLRAEGGTAPRGEDAGGGDEHWWLAARLASGMPPALGDGVRKALLAKADKQEEEAAEKDKVRTRWGSRRRARSRWRACSS